MKLIRVSLLLSIGALLLMVSILTHQSEPTTAEAAITAITCNDLYTSSTYVTGLSSPDGLALSPDGLVHVAEETSGEITRINADNSQTVVLSGLTSPEGIAFDADGNLYVVEDKANGRLIRQEPSSATTTLTSDLLAPEGVVVADNGTVYVTESGLQLININDPSTYIDLDLLDPGSIDFTDFDPNDFQIITDTLVSRIKAFAPTAPFTSTTILTATPEYIVTPTLVGVSFAPPATIYDLEVEVDFLSLSGITLDANGDIFVSAELSNFNTEQFTTTNQTIEGTPIGTVIIRNVTVRTSSSRSVLQVNPSTGVSVTHVSHLTATEGVRFMPNGQHPLYIVQEDTSGLANLGTGRLDIADSNGATSILCDGFSTLEDVLLDANETIYVSEDGTGSIIQIVPPSRVSLPLIIRP